MKNPAIKKIERYCDRKGIYYNHDGSDDQILNINIGVERQIEVRPWVMWLLKYLRGNL